MQAAIPDELRDRVFIVGAWTTPEKLRTRLGISYESIGKEIARDCMEDRYDTWQHELLRHNLGEIKRMQEGVRPILFGSF